MVVRFSTRSKVVSCICLLFICCSLPLVLSSGDGGSRLSSTAATAAPRVPEAQQAQYETTKLQASEHEWQRLEDIKAEAQVDTCSALGCRPAHQHSSSAEQITAAAAAADFPLDASAVEVDEDAMAQDDFAAHPGGPPLLYRKRSHPPASSSSVLSPAVFWSLIRPTFPRQSAIPIGYVALASFLLFAMMYAFSEAIHDYLTDSDSSAWQMKEHERAMRRADVEERKRERDMQQQDGARRRLSTRPVVHVIPASSPASHHSRGIFASYLRAYVYGRTHSLTTSIEWHSRLVSNAHAFLSVAMGALCLLTSSSKVDSDVLRGTKGVSTDAHVPAVSRSGASLFNPFSSSFTPSLAAFNEDLLRDLSLMITVGYLAYDFALCVWVRIKFRNIQDPFWSKEQNKAAQLAATKAKKEEEKENAASSAAAASPSPSPSPAPPQAPAVPARSSRSSSSSSSPPPIRIDDGLTLVHHVLILFAFSFGSYSHIGTFIMSCFLLNEASTPLLNTNFFLACIRVGEGAKEEEDKEERELRREEEELNGEQEEEEKKQQHHSNGHSPSPSSSSSSPWRDGGYMSRLYQLNGIILFLVFFLLRVVFNLYVLCTMVLTWSRLHVLWLGAEFPLIGAAPASLPPVELATGALLSILAAGHVTINLLWFGALAKAIKRKLRPQKKKAAAAVGVKED